MGKLFVILLVLALLTSCDKAKKNEDGYEVFVIKQGHHESFSGLIPLKDSILNFKAIFDSSAIYSITDTTNVTDVNKLFGMTDCGVANHFNSARIGWRWFRDSLQLFAYVYANGNRSITYMTSVRIGKEIPCSITATKDKYIFWANNVSLVMKRECYNNERFLLYPFFGGDERAPHQITIKVAY